MCHRPVIYIMPLLINSMKPLLLCPPCIIPLSESLWTIDTCSQAHTLSYIVPMPLCLCGEIQGDFILDGSSTLTSYKYVESSLFSQILLYFNPSCFETIHVPFVGSPFLEISLDSPFTLIICLGVQNILNMYIHVILGVLKLSIKVPSWSCIIVPKLFKKHVLMLKWHTLISITTMIPHI